MMGKVMLFAFPDANTYDAGTPETAYPAEIRLFNEGGKQLERLTAAQRQKIREQKAAILNRRRHPGSTRRLGSRRKTPLGSSVLPRPQEK
jgi:hypothetical protein